MRKLLIYSFCFLLSGFAFAQTPSSYMNAVVHSKMRVATTNDADAADPTKALINIHYYDGLGRKVQTVGYRQSPLEKDILSEAVVFDQYGRQVKTILPAPTSASDGGFKANPESIAQSFYADSYPLSEITGFDNSPLNRPTQQFGPGLDWRGSAGSPTTTHPNRTVYSHNAAGEVRLYVTDINGNISIAAGTYYPAGSLYKTISVDEQGDSSIVFTDIVGNTIETWQQVGHGEYAKTHFLYFHGDRIKAVIQPMGVALGTALSAGSANWNNYVFFYRYDSRARIIEKKVPGAEAEYFVFDKWDRLVASQTALQRDPASGLPARWSFFKYDALGRQVVSGEYYNIQSRSALQAAVATFESGQQHLFETRNATGPVYYTLSNTFPSTVTASDVRHISYYDDYAKWRPADMAFDAGNAYHSLHPESRGDLTGTKAKKTEDSNWLITASYFDQRNRLIQSFAQNTYGHTERTDFEYLFAGEVAKVRVVHKKPDNSSITELTENSYDYAGRLILVKHGLNAAADTLCTLSYDELGRLSEKKIRPQYQYFAKSVDFIIRNAPAPTNTEDIYKQYVLLEPGFIIDADDPDTYLAQIDTSLAPPAVIQGLQTMNYGYHLRGMLNCVNCDNGTPSLNQSQNDLFAYKLDFQEVGKWDGNIGKQSWVSRVSSTFKSYAYGYDRADRLLSANYTGSKDFSVPSLAYDLNGNIQNLSRKGDGGFIDQLTYQYQGNRLLSVGDAVSGNQDVGDFRDGNTSGDDYTYWPDGSLKSDANKGISLIEYDTFLNKKKQITYSNGDWVKWFYDGSGNLLKRTNSKNLTSSYSMNIIYMNDTIQQLDFGSGRIVFDSAGNTFYEFEYRDHLGNLRLAVRDTTIGNPVTRAAPQIMETVDYYPFGLRHFNSYGIHASNSQRYLYNGIEFNEEVGIYDAQFRNLDPTIGRWWQKDIKPNYSHSLYSSMRNNPISFTDYLGDTTYHFNREGVFIGISGLEDVGITGAISKIKYFTNEDGEVEKGFDSEQYFDFNDPDIDVDQLVSLREGEKVLNIMDDDNIELLMSKSGIEHKNILSRFHYAKSESSVGEMDFAIKYLSDGSYEGHGGRYGHFPEEPKGFYLFGNSRAYNVMDAGNFLWGHAMKRLGFDYSTAELGSQWNEDFQDSPGDQRAIRSGYHYETKK